LALLAVAFLIDERESASMVIAVPLFLFAYNCAAYIICTDQNLYGRLNFWPGVASRALDLAVLTVIAARLGLHDSAVYLLYSMVVVGAGFVYGLAAALATCAAAIGLVAFVAMVTGPGVTAMLRLNFMGRLALLPLAAFVGTYLSREFENERGRRESFKRLEGIYRLGSHFSTDLDVDQIMHKTVQMALDLTYADRCRMTLYDPETLAASEEVFVTRQGSSNQPSAEPGTGIVAEFQSDVQAKSRPSGRSQLDDQQTPGAMPPTRIEAALSVGTKVVGKLEIESWDPETTLGDNEAHLLSVLATQAAIAVQNARMVEELQLQAETDPLTGLLNRRVLSKRMEYEVQRAVEHGYSISVFILDLDDFKSVNDTYGHAAGDRVLQEIAGMLEQCTREGDFCARYGGDEFVLVLRSVGPGEALAAAARIKKRIERSPISIDGKRSYKARLSGGVACTSLDGYGAEDLLHRADERLLRAKSLRKSRICGPQHRTSAKTRQLKHAA